MGVRLVIAAAAVVFSVGQADAATFNAILHLAYQKYHCDMGPCDTDPVAATDFLGMSLYQKLTGIFEIPEDGGRGYVDFYDHVDGINYYSFGTYTRRGNILFANEDIMVNYFSFSWETNSGYFDYWDDNVPYSREVRGTITIIEPSPVPLPASAALLPMGMGALALMRRRRRS